MSDATTFLYFAYGSNMLTRRLRARTPSARVVEVARLPGHALRWHKVSRDGSGKCDIVAVDSADEAVLGVVFEIAVADQPELDHAEGLGKGYAELQIEVQGARGPILARTYRATNTDHLALPYDWYKALVLAGAREHGLPEPYLRAIEAVRTKSDRDQARHATHLALALEA
ncbi:MAG: gamma-glutamylcyclotransferase [Piscinibacter sp.]|nr:gamma-glutamylcyclotransferase [Piscinibacter sp.]